MHMLANARQHCMLLLSLPRGSVLIYLWLWKDQDTTYVKLVQSLVVKIFERLQM